MFHNARKIKKLETEIEDLKKLCTQLTSNAIMMLKDQAILTETIKTLLRHQKVMDKFIHTKYNIKLTNDDDIIH